MHDANTKAAILEGLPEWMVFAFCNPDAVRFTADARCGHSKVETSRSKEQRLILLKYSATSHSYDWRLFVS